MTARVIYSMNVSLDGFIEDANGSLDFASVDEEIHRFFEGQDAAVATAVYGRRLWDVMASHWPTADRLPEATPWEVDYARTWQRMPKVVVSRSLAEVSEPLSRLTRDDVVDVVRELKASMDGEISIAGPTLAASVIAADLVDEYRPVFHPAIVGGGKRYLPEGVSLDLRLLETRRFDAGVVYHRYERRR